MIKILDGAGDLKYLDTIGQGTTNDPFILRKQITKFGNGTPTIGTFGQLITAYEVPNIAIKWEYGAYETNYDMLPVVSTGDGAQSIVNGNLIASSATTGTVMCQSRKVTRYRTGRGGFALKVPVASLGTNVTSRLLDFEKLGILLDRGEELVITKEELVAGSAGTPADGNWFDFSWQELF